MSYYDLVNEEATNPKRVFESYADVKRSQDSQGLFAQIEERKAELRIIAKAKQGSAGFYQHKFRQFGSAFAGQFLGSQKPMPKRVVVPSVVKTEVVAAPEYHAPVLPTQEAMQDHQRNEIGLSPMSATHTPDSDEGSPVFTVQLEAHAEIPEFVTGIQDDGKTASAGPFKPGQHFFVDAEIAETLISHKLAKKIGSYGGN